MRTSETGVLLVVLGICITVGLIGLVLRMKFLADCAQALGWLRCLFLL